MRLKSFFPIITSATIAITTILGCTIAQAVTLTGEQKLQAISTLAYSQNLFFIGGFANKNSSNLNISNVEFTPESLIFNSSTQLGNSLFTSNYNSTYYFNSDTVIWNQLGILGNHSWSFSGTASFLDDNQTIVWNSNGSINPTFSVALQLMFNGEEWTGGFSGGISDDLSNGGSNDYGSYDINAIIELYEENNSLNFRSSVRGNYFKIIDQVRIGVSGEVSYTPTGDTTGSITGQISSVPEPLTIFGSGIGLGLGVLFKKEYSRKQKKVKNLEKQKA
jgi:hypothetical protein